MGSAYGWNSNFEIYNKDKKHKKKGEEHSHSNKIEVIMKNVVIHSVGFDEEYDLLYVSSSDNKLNLYTTDGGKSCTNYLQVFTGNDCELTSLLLGKQQNVLFAGTNKGSIRVYLWPILKKKQ